VKVKHSSVFEAVQLSGNKPDPPAVHRHPPDHHPNVIQKLMAAPVVGPEGTLGVIEISRKGVSAPAAGADFTSPTCKSWSPTLPHWQSVLSSCVGWQVAPENGELK